ncbi:hypothetical protein EB1_30530 [Empedobacter brevis NBRC 14943 = ATCC 43319]|uniref:Molybdopterin-guanine dinucleotide biosynthesis protein MobB n=1 Tax=Empedobacter brevis NBRC 14943 = ATCC 43319 TaxID=1218108 RepID=A0A511NKF7_9FLAO|nr:DUF5712 family protein [Empedobacter brevis]GEM53263.1 hypothetical protein EB1_30530 [Empedobacter brevis NBRC 14943 = ATCC 43319]
MMFIRITHSETGNNKGSCGQLVKYLEKENKSSEQKKELEYWFNHQNKTISPQEVRVNIDHNIAKLSRNDAKFFLINISPSEQEIMHLKERFGNKGTEEKLKEYASNVMDAYAQNFKRNGIENGKDLLWYGKLEHHRYYHHTDEEVKQGLLKVGETKTGEQMHIQIIVSRKDRTNKIKLSPMNTSRGKNQSHSAKLGQFDRVAFKESGEQIFDNMFEFNRSLEDSIHYKLIMKNGNTEQKKVLNFLEDFEAKSNNTNQEIILNTVNELYKNRDIKYEEFVDINNNFTTNIFNIFSQSDPSIQENVDHQIPLFIKKKRKLK